MPTNRRNFLKAGAMSAVAAGALASAPHVHAAGSDTLRIALIGCGGRGRGAGMQALSTGNKVEIVAIADAFEEQAKGFAEILKEEKPECCKFTDETIFHGLDAYKKAIDCLIPGDIALLVAPPAFRAMHFEYAVKRGVHIFLEKPFGVDTPTLKRSMAAWEEAKKKGLKIITGLNNRKYFRTKETVEAIQDGALGDILSCWVYRLHGPILCNPHPEKNWTPLQIQLRNYNSFIWTSGSPTVDWMIHNIDICCWARKQHPVWCQGTGGRQTNPDFQEEIPDHIGVEYHFDDGVRMMVQVRHIPNTWGWFRSVIQGSKGMAVVGEGIRDPHIFKGYREATDEIVWAPKSEPNDSYQTEHCILQDWILNDKPIEEDISFCIKSNMMSIMGRMAMESGQAISYDTAMNSTYELCPNLDNLDFYGDSPYIMPDENGNYPCPKPGITKRF